MPTLVLNNVPELLYDRVQSLAKKRDRTPADTVLEVLENAFRTPTIVSLVEPPLPQEPIPSEEICAPCSIPRPDGTPVRALQVPPPLPAPHDLPDLGENHV